MEMLFPAPCFSLRLCGQFVCLASAAIQGRALAKVRPVIYSNQHRMITNIKHGCQSANQVMMLRPLRGGQREGEGVRTLAERQLISGRHLNHAIKLMYGAVRRLLAREGKCVCGRRLV